MQNKPTGFANPWLHLALSIAFVAIYELLLKLGAAETAHLSARWSWTGLTGLASPYVWVAIVFVILSLLTWLHALRHLPLSIRQQCQRARICACRAAAPRPHPERPQFLLGDQSMRVSADRLRP